MAAPFRLAGRWVVALASLVSVLVTSNLGMWQLSRAAQKEALVSARQARAAMPPVSAAEMADALAAMNWEPLHHRLVTVRGRWVDRGTVYLNNRTMNGQVGFFVVTPLAVEGLSGVILVQRGWVPRDPSNRERLPELETPTGVVVIEGRFAPPPSRMYELGQEGAGRIRQNLSPSELSAELGLRVESVSIQQQNSTEQGGVAGQDGLLRQWPTSFPDVHKHYGYAFQWFGLTALVVVLYVWFQIIAPRRRRNLA